MRAKQLARVENEATWSTGREELVAFWVMKVQVNGDNGLDRGHAFSFPGFHVV